MQLLNHGRVATGRTSEERLTFNRDQKERTFGALSREEHEKLLQHRRRRRKVLVGAESDQENSVRRGKNSDREYFRRLDNFNAACNGDLHADNRKEGSREGTEEGGSQAREGSEQKLQLTNLATSGNRERLATDHSCCMHSSVCVRQVRLELN